MKLTKHEIRLLVKYLQEINKTSPVPIEIVVIMDKMMKEGLK
jgi:hypothetical protein